MKKKVFIILFAFICAVSVACFAACSCNPKTPDTPDISDDQISEFTWSITMPNGVDYPNVQNVPAISVYEEFRIKVSESATYALSDTEIASVSENGTVRGKKAGSATVTVTTATGTKQLNFVVNEAGNVPVIVFENSNVPKNEGQYECSMFVNGTINVGAKLKYNGLAYTSDITFIYETEDSNVATITNGTICAVGEGSTTISVSVSDWRGYSSPNLTQVITVDVKPTVSLSVSEENLVLYTKIITNEIKSYELAPAVVVNDNAVEDASFAYEYDDKIVSIDENGKVTAVSEGETTVTVKYTTSGGFTVEKNLNVKVVMPVVDSNVTFMVDKSGMTLDKSLFSLEENESYVRISDEKTSSFGNFEDNKFKGCTAFGTGEQTLVVYSNLQGYRITANVVDKIIRTEDDLISLKTTKDVNAYYVLGADVTLSKTFDGITSGTFTGIFDGQGYSISGGKFTYGLLGQKTLNATVRNLAIIDVGIAAYPSNPTTCVAGLMAHTMTGTTTIKNLYLKMKNPDQWSAAVGVWVYKVEGTLNADNVVSYVASDRTNMSSFISWTPDVKFNLNNVYCGSQVSMKAIVTSAPTVLDITQYNSLAAMKTAYADNQIDISWAKDYSFYNSLTTFLNA